MRQVFWAVLLIGLLGLVGTIYFSAIAQDLHYVDILGRVSFLVIGISVAGIFASWLAEKISLRPFASAAVDQGGEPADTNNQPQLAAQMAWGLIWFGGVGAVSAWSLIFVFGSSSALVLLTRVTYVAGLAGLACFAVLKVLRAAEKQEPWVATAQSGAGAVRLGLMGWLRYAFSFSGSVSRPRFLVSQLAAGIIQIVSILWLLESPASLFPWLMILAAGVSMLAFGARRTRDTGVSQWWFLLVLVPALNLAVLAFLFLVPTDEFRGAASSTPKTTAPSL